jgi:uncharacterized protein (AIM24 family)
VSTGTTAGYVCRFCRLPSDPTGASCPNCGAPFDVKVVVSDSGWEEQPPVRDMARIQCGRSHCQVSGVYVPVVDMNLAAEDMVYFSHHVLLWVEPSVTMSTMPMRGGFNRLLAGMPLVMMQATGPGHIAFSQDAPGETVAIPLQHGQAIDVREHRFLVATHSVGYDWFDPGVWFTTRSGDETETHYPLGRFLDRFAATEGPGLLLLHAPGNTFVRDLQPGQSILVQPTALLYKDPTVRVDLHLEYPGGSGLSVFGSSFANRTVWLRATGPGRIAVQSVFERPETAAPITSHSPATTHTWR